MVRGPRLRCGCAAVGCRCLPARSSLAPLRGAVCDVGTILPRTVTSPPRTVTSQPANGGNCSIRGATRRRHAEARLLMVQNPHHCPWCHAPRLLQDCPARRWLNALARHLQSKAIQARGRAQIRTIKGSSGRVEVFQMDGVGISIIERPRPLPQHDTPNPLTPPLHPQMRRVSFPRMPVLLTTVHPDVRSLSRSVYPVSRNAELRRGFKDCHWTLTACSTPRSKRHHRCALRPTHILDTQGDVA